MNLEISLEDLLKNGSHFGHNKKRWNPKMEKFIYGEKNGTHILDLRKSLPLIENALKFYCFRTMHWKCTEILHAPSKISIGISVQFSEAVKFQCNCSAIFWSSQISVQFFGVGKKVLGCAKWSRKYQQF